MVNRDVVAAKLSELADRVARVRQHCPPTVSDLASSRDQLDLVSFNLMLAVQTCADLASHIIADEGWPSAQNLADGFRRLAQNGVVVSATAESLANAVGLRNIVAHGYAGIDPELVHRAGTHGIADLEAFAREVATWVLGR